MTVVPSGSGSTWAAWKRRKSANSRCRTLTATETCSGDSHRHQQVAKVVVLRAPDGRGARGVRGLDDHFVSRDGLDTVDEVRRVECNHEVLAGVIAVDRLRSVTDVLALHAEVHASRPHGEPDGRGVVPNEELNPTQCGKKCFLPQMQTVRIVVRDELLVVRVAAFEET